MKKFFKHFAFMVFMTLTTGVLTSCDTDALHGIGDTNNYAKLTGNWTFESRTVDGDQTVASHLPYPAWMKFSGYTDVTYDYQGETIEGSTVPVFDEDKLVSLTLMPKFKPSSSKLHAKNYVFAVSKVDDGEMTLEMTDGDLYSVTLTYRK